MPDHMNPPAAFDPEFQPPPGVSVKPAAASPPAPDLAARAFAWLARHQRGVLIAGVVYQLGLLLGMVVVFARPHLDPNSRTVLLRVVPVDPRDLLRGDYVILGYGISRLSPSNALAVQQGQSVYVTLEPEPDGQHYDGHVASDKPPAPGIPFIRGTFMYPGRIEYGIESYYVQEGQGREYEDAVRSRKLSAEVVIAPDGTASLKRLVIE